MWPCRCSPVADCWSPCSGLLRPNQTHGVGHVRELEAFRLAQVVAVDLVREPFGVAHGEVGEVGAYVERGTRLHAPVDGYFTVVLNTNPYTYLGNRPLDLSPAATLDRGLVAVTFRTMRVTAILGGLGGALRGGGVKPSRTLDLQTDLQELHISHATGFPYQVDGDYLGETKHLEFRHVPDAVRLVRPQPV